MGGLRGGLSKGGGVFRIAKDRALSRDFVARVSLRTAKGGGTSLNSHALGRESRGEMSIS